MTAMPTHSVITAASHFSSGRYDLLLDRCSDPLPVYPDRQPPVAMSRRDMWSFLQSLHSGLASKGMPVLEGRVAATELARNGKFRRWADWFGVTATGKRRPVLRTVSYIRQTDTGAEVCMLHIQGLRALENSLGTGRLLAVTKDSALTAGDQSVLALAVGAALAP